MQPNGTISIHATRRLAALALLSLTLIAIPYVASAQLCNNEQFDALASGPNHKFKFSGFTPLTFANLDPIADGVDINLNGTLMTIPPGAHAGGGTGTAGWVAHTNNNLWTYKDSDGTDPKYKARIKTRQGSVQFKFGMGKVASLAFLTGSVDPNNTPLISFDASGEGCASNFMNDEINQIEECRDNNDPTKIDCTSSD